LPAELLSGSSGTVTSRRASLRDALLDVRALPLRRRLARAARGEPPRRRVLVLGVERPDGPGLMGAARAELERSRHEVSVHTTSPGERGKFENLGALLDEHPPQGYDWLLMVDDDVTLPGGFLDGFLLLAERFGLRLAQPAHRRRSHAAWEVTRRPRSGGTTVRETRFVEIGPVTALHAETFPVLLPFPPTRMGWGLDLHWGAVARERGWRMGVVDALPIGHAAGAVGSSYSTAEAEAEAEAFLSGRPHLSAAEAQEVVAVHRGLAP
jgi:hypothetical protein